MNISERAKNLQDQMVAWRRDLHRIPELGLILPKTAKYVMDRLDEMGIAYQTYEGHSGIVATIGHGDGKVVAIRADMDALAIEEETGLEYASENENMHACGHDGHTAMLLGAAKMFKDDEDKLPGKIKLLFQPAEEGPGGAYPMVVDGVLKNPDVDYILGLHLGDLTRKDAKNGEIAVGYSNMMAADDQLYIKINGKGAHGSTPEAGVDPVAIAALVINNLQYIRAREVKSSIPSVITIGSVQAGRGTYNIIPDYAELFGTIRNANLETRNFVFQRIEEIVKAVCEGNRATYELEFLDGYPALINDRKVVEVFLEKARNLVGEENIHMMDGPVMGGEDAAFFFQQVPGCYFFLASSAPHPESGEIYYHHNSKFCIDESVFHLGATLFYETAFDLMQK